MPDRSAWGDARVRQLLGWSAAAIVGVMLLPFSWTIADGRPSEQGWVVPSAAVPDRPDIVLVMTDEQRFDWVGHASGGFFETPFLDQLAADGIVFEHAWSAATTCVPSRTALLTGLHHNRVPQAPGSIAIEPGFWTIARELGAAGYETALIGRMHLTPVHADHGFETMRMCENINIGSGYGSDDTDDYGRWLAAEGRPDWRLVDPDGAGGTRPALAGIPRTFPDSLEYHSTAWIEREAVSFLRNRRRDRPLFMIVSFPHPHAPYDPPEPYASMYDPADVEIPTDGIEVNAVLESHFATSYAQFRDLVKVRTTDTAGNDHYRRVITAIRGLVRQIDDAMERIVDELDLARTLLVFTSDHGDFGGHRGLYTKLPWFPFEDLVRVPLVVTGGPVAGSGRTVEACVQTGSFAATCLDVAGMSAPSGVLDFPSLEPFLDDRPDATVDAPVVAAISVGFPAVRIGRYKVIGSWTPGELMLFDLEDDPGETRSLADDPDLAEVLAVAGAALRAEMAKPPPDLRVGWAAAPA